MLILIYGSVLSVEAICADENILIIESDAMEDVGASYVNIGKKKLILLSSSLPTQSHTFFLFHELYHHFVPPINRATTIGYDDYEVNADSFAIRAMAPFISSHDTVHTIMETYNVSFLTAIMRKNIESINSPAWGKMFRHGMRKFDIYQKVLP